MTTKEIFNRLPYGKSFLFVDELLHVDENGAVGKFTFDETLPFYEGHFKNFPITPAVILIETMAQIGLVCLGIYLLKDEPLAGNFGVAMTSNSIDFIKPVFPGESVVVTSEKIYFRFNKLNCKVKMENAWGELVCKGVISGMITTRSDERK